MNSSSLINKELFPLHPRFGMHIRRLSDYTNLRIDALEDMFQPFTRTPDV
ncbi:hypothetical protein KEJ27_01605 [Candidatus Bathyarchaeota archaeon]|nr:hypothetical protein [Candidatus Bathyarchaeota archaeon]MBS7617655.1 hypothetical protein [Candidatus Bathyarchaeota archaeon]